MRSPAPMHNVALRWGGVGLSTYGTCSVDAVRPSCSTQAKKRLMVILLSMRQHDPSTGPQSPVRAGRQSARPTRVESGQRRDARRSHTAAQRPRRPTPGRTGHRARATTQHARQVAHDTPASHRGRAQGPGRGRGGHVDRRPESRPSVSIDTLNHVSHRACPHAWKGAGPHPWQHTLRGALRLGSTAHPVLSPSCSSPIAM